MPITIADCVRLELNLLGGRGSNISDQRAVLQVLSQKQIRPAVDRVMKLEEIKAAHEHQTSGQIQGRILLTPLDETEE